MVKSNLVIVLLRHDLRLSDHPIFDHLASTSSHGFTHLVVVYVLNARQFEVSGFIRDGSPSPYPEARCTMSKVWRTGPHRAKFITQSIWNLKKNLESVGSDLLIRAGNLEDVTRDLVEGFSEKHEHVGAVWMTSEEGVEEHRDQEAVSAICKKHAADFKLWEDEKYYVDE